MDVDLFSPSQSDCDNGLPTAEEQDMEEEDFDFSNESDEDTIFLDSEVGTSFGRAVIKMEVLDKPSPSDSDINEASMECLVNQCPPGSGHKKRDAAGSLMGRRFDSSQSSYKQTLTLFSGKEKVGNVCDAKWKPCNVSLLLTVGPPLQKHQMESKVLEHEVSTMKKYNSASTQNIGVSILET